MMTKPTLQSESRSAAKLLQYAENILFKMTENADLYPEPDPSLATLQTTITAFREAVTEAAFRDKRNVVIKNQQMAVLRQVIYKLSLYVEKVAMGDSAMILASGFLPSRTGKKAGSPPKPTNFRMNLIRIGNQTVELRVSAWASIRLYQFEYRKASGETDWKTALSSRSTCVLEGLEKLQEYEFRVAYIGTDPTVTYSDTLRSYVL